MAMHYRREIDGLRAVAVLPVIFFHAGFPAFSGGYVGVDVFFVISGYLITSIILTEQKERRFSILNFYERRIRRILPALFLVMSACLPPVWFMMLPYEIKEFSQSLVAVTAFLSNILFWLQSGYFDTAAELKPLLHTWSLAVEEQFYVIFPLFIAVAWRFGIRIMTLVLVIISLLSICFAQWMAVNSFTAGFFMLPTRAWELAIGALIAFGFATDRFIALNAIHKQLVSAAGLMMILIAVVLFDKSTPFPGFYAALPALGAALVIVGASSSNYVGTLLGSPVFVGIGLISFSAYLWHQPLFAFARHQTSIEESLSLFTFLCFATFGLAYVSWRWVEQPFRSKDFLSRRQVFALASAASVFFVFLGITGHRTNGFQTLYYEFMLTQDQRMLADYSRYNESEEFWTAYRHGTCFYGSEMDSFESFDKNECLKMSKTKENYLIFGDSHAAHLYFGLAHNFPEINFMQATASGCLPLFGMEGEKRCTDLVDYVINDFLPKNQIDGIILAGRWDKDSVSRIADTLRILKGYVSRVNIVGPTAEYTAPLPQLLLKVGSDGSEKKLTDFLVRERIALSNQMAQLARSPTVRFVPIIDVICPKGKCAIYSHGKMPLVWDYGHFTKSGSVRVVKLLKDRGFLDFGQHN
jgi:peptidoglycan/LPS O-acetylase OafA/YrhL